MIVYIYRLRNYYMKQIFIIAFLLSATVSLKGQIVEGKDGLYYDENNDLFSGVYIELYENGQVKTEMALRNGQKHGITKIYFDSGKINEFRSFKKSLMHGKWETWNEPGKKIAEANYRNGKKDGKWYVWDENGTLRYDMIYKKGKKTGTWFIFDEKGKEVNSKKYDNIP